MRLGDIFAVIIGVGVFAVCWWDGARRHATVDSKSRRALRVSKPIARFFGSRRSDNIVSVDGVGLHLLTYEWVIVVLLYDFTAVPWITIQNFGLIFTTLMLLAGGIHWWRNRDKKD